MTLRTRAHFRRNIALLFFASASLLCPAIVAQSYNFYVGNSRGDDVTVIDLQTLTATRSIKAGDRVHGVAVSEDGKTLFITVESDHTLRVLDARDGAQIAKILLSGLPNQCAVTPDERFVVVPLRDKATVDVVDVAKREVVREFHVDEPHNAVATVNSHIVFVSSMRGNEIDKIDLNQFEIGEHIPVGGRPRPFVVTRDGRTAYVALAYLHGFAEVNLKPPYSLKRVEIPAVRKGSPKPRKFETPDTFTHGLALTPDEKELWVTSLLDDAVYIFDLQSSKIVATLPTGDGPNWIVFTPDGKIAGITDTDSNDVSVFDVRAHIRIATVRVGMAPKRIAVGIKSPVPDR